MELKKLKRTGIIILVLLLLLFIFTNIRPVEITLFFWHFDMPLALLILLTVLTGFVLGIVAALSLSWKKDKSDKPDSNGEQSGPANGKST